MTKRPLAFVAVALIVLLAVSAAVLLRRSLQREREMGVGEKFPPVQLQLISAENELVRFPSGKKTLVVFFNHKCPHCVNELSRLDKACQQIPGGKIECLAVSFGREQETRAWLMMSGLNLKTAIVADPDFTTRYVDWLTAVPLVFLVDENGKIRYKRAGERGDDFDASLVRDFAK